MTLQSANVPEIVTIEQWDGINQSSNRSTIGDQESWWLENMFPIAPGLLRSGYGPSAPIYTGPPGVPILRIFFTNITSTSPVGFMFLADGTVDQVTLDTGVVTGLGQIWAPQSPYFWADVKLWKIGQPTAGGVVIGSPKGLYAWDGATVTGPGQTPPLWLTDGATLDANGQPLVMPSGLPGIFAMEVYNDRLWVLGQLTVAFSAAGNASDFSVAGGGGAFPYHGDQLTLTRTDMHATGGFLYLFNDSSIDVVQNVTTISGQGPSGTAGPIINVSTQFQVQNTDPQIGQRFARPVGVWEQTFTLYNGSGIYLLAGSQVVWISPKITNLLATIQTVLPPNPVPALPTMAPAHIFGKKWMLFCGFMTDPFGTLRSMLLCWSGPQEGKWIAASQNLDLTQISSYEENSVITPYGTDGTSLYRLFAQPDPALLKRITSKLYFGNPVSGKLTIKSWKRIYCEMQDLADSDGTFITGGVMTYGGGIPNGTEAVSFSVNPKSYDIVPFPLSAQGMNAGWDLRSTSPDFFVARVSMTFDERALFGA